VLPDKCDGLNYDLKPGFEKFIDHIPHQHFIDNLLKWIINNKEKLVNKEPTETKLVM
jgi:hypothetical protein